MVARLHSSHPREAEGLSSGFLSGWQDLRNDYMAGTNSRFMPQITGVHPLGSGADYHYRNEKQFLYMIERAREFDRNNLVVGQGINRLVSNIMQDGFSLDIQTGDEGIDEALSDAFWDWADDPYQCDDEGERDFGGLASLALRHRFVDGDCLALPLAEGPLCMVEAHRLRTPTGTKRNVVHGILLDERRRRQEYWLTKADVDPMKPVGNVGAMEKYPARDKQGNPTVYHIYDPQRISQTRGVTAFATLCYALGLHDDIQFATLVKAQVASSWAILRELAEESTLPSLHTDAKAATGTRYTETNDDGTTRTVGGISPGMDVRGRPGEKITGFSPNIPNPEFFPHALMVLTFIAVNLDMPVAVFLLDPKLTNFSGWRGAIDQARIRFRWIQRWLIQRFHMPVYRWRVRRMIQSDAALAGRLKSGTIKLFNHKWNPPTWRYIEPSKDAKADELRLDKNLISNRRRAAEQGMDWDELRKECVDDRVQLFEYAQERAVELQKKHKDMDVTWRDLASVAPPGSVKAVDPNTIIKTEAQEAAADSSPEGEE